MQSIDSDQENVYTHDGIIKIYNPNDIPFGPLSNNAIYPMQLDNKLWNTVTHYILTNMLISPVYKAALYKAPIHGIKKNTNILDKVKAIVANTEKRKGVKITPVDFEKIRVAVLRDVEIERMSIYDLFNYYIGQENFHTVRTALEKAYNTRVSKNQDMVDSLIATGNAPIVYISNNELLGVNSEGKGYNLIGITLMQIRHNLIFSEKEIKNLREKDKLGNLIYALYIVLNLLEKKIKTGSDLSEYLGKTPKQILMKQGPDFIKKLKVNDIEKQTVLEMYEKGQYPILTEAVANENSPNRIKDFLVLRVRKEYLRELLQGSKIESFTVPYLVMTMYTEYLIKQKYPNMPKEEIELAVGELLNSAPTIEDYNKMRERVYILYENNKLPSDLQKSINAKLEEIRAPLIKELEKTELNIKKDQPLPSSKENIVQVSSPTSSDEEDSPLKNLLSDDTKFQKNYLIKKLEKLTGHSKQYYKEYTIEKLKKKLEEFGEKNIDITNKNLNRWEVWVTYPKIVKGKRTEKLAEFVQKPSEKEMEEIVENYNKNNAYKIRRGLIIAKLKSKAKYEAGDNTSSEVEQLGEIKKEEKVEVTGYIKPNGKPIEIRGLIEANPKDLQIFSPLYYDEFAIDNIVYTDISRYITTAQLTKTGFKIVKDGEFVKYVRGISFSEAHKKLDKALNPEAEAKVYHDEYRKTFETMSKFFADRALEEKFKNMNLQNLLLLTGDATLIWNDVNDIILGVGSKKVQGENYIGQTLMKIRKNLPKQDYQIIKVENIKNFILSDPFMMSWIKMRVQDMCTTVYRLKHFLWEADNLEENINPRFVNHVLNFVYYPCSSLTVLSKKNTLLVPDEIVGIVETCKGIKLKYSKDYNAEFAKIDKEKSEEDRIFHRLPLIEPSQTKVVPNLDKLQKDNDKELARLKKKGASEDEIKKFIEKSQKEIELYTKLQQFKQKRQTQDKLENKLPEKQTFEQKQALIWQKTLKELTKPAKNPEEIAEKLKEQQEKLDNLLSKIKDPTKLAEAKIKAKKTLDDLRKKLNKSLLDKNEIQSKLTELTIKQERDRKLYYEVTGNDTEKKSPEEIKNHEKFLENITKKFIELNRDKKNEEEKYDTNNVEIAQIYWNRIVVMLYFILERNKDKIDEQTMRKSIADAVLLNSDKISCENINKLPSSSIADCITSALLNLLIGIHQFKHQYAEHLELSKKDIDLAGSIILNKDLSEIVPNENIEVEEEKEEKEENIVFEHDFAEEIDQEIDLETLEHDYGDNLSDLGDEERSVEFGMKYKASEIDISTHLTNITGYDIKNIKELTKYFLAVVKKIKKYKMSNDIKVNRINFFATSRS